MKKLLFLSMIILYMVGCKKDSDDSIVNPEEKPAKKCQVYSDIYIPSINDVIRYHGPNCDSLYMDLYLGNYEAWMIGDFMHVDTGDHVTESHVNSSHTMTLSKDADGFYYLHNFWGKGETILFYAVGLNRFFIKQFPDIIRDGNITEPVSTDGKLKDGVVNFDYSGGTFDHVKKYVIDHPDGTHDEYNYNIQFIKK